MASTSTDRRHGVNSGAAVKVPVRVATTAAITLSGEQTIDGVAVVDGDRVLVKDQASGSANGIYVCDTGIWERDADFDGSYDVKSGTFVYARSGSTNTGFWYITTSDPITIGTTSLTFARASTVLATITAFVQTLLDDADADSFVQTLVAALTAEASPATDDVVLLGDTSESKGNKMTLENVLKVINLLTEDTNPVRDLDFGVTYDASASGPKKVAVKNYGQLVQRVRVSNANYVSTAGASIPFDNSIPQSTEGLVIIANGAITPKSATNILRFFVSIPIFMDAAGTGTVTISLIPNAGGDALAATSMFLAAASGGTLTMQHEVVAGAVTAQTFKVHVGPSAGARTVYINGNDTERKFGGVSVADLIIEEIVP